MEVGREMDAIFANTRHAVHVAFFVMGQPAMQDAPLRKALIRVMDSIRLDGGQREWLEELRGAPSDGVNFGGLSGEEVRAQCAMITQAVKHLPPAEMWTLQATYDGYVDFEDAPPGKVTAQQLHDALERAHVETEDAREKMRQARLSLDTLREQYLASAGKIARQEAETLAREHYYAARDDVRDAGAAVARAESIEYKLQVAVDRIAGRTVTDGSAPAIGGDGRRFAFSATRIDAIKGLSDWLRPLFPRIKPLAIDCMLGRLFAKHKKIGISFEDIAKSFGGNSKLYQRASFKMQNHLLQLEQLALQHLEDRLVKDGIALPTESD